MTLAEPTATAWILLTTGALVALSVLLSRALRRFSVPIFLTFLGLGMAAGSEGIGGIAFEDYALAFRLGTLALTLILFDAGLNTSLATVRRAIAPAAVLATAGVLGTAGLLALAAVLLGLPWPVALLLGAVVSSTDAAAVFSVLRGSGLRVRGRAGAVLELESGLNDPLALLLTVGLTTALATGEGFRLSLLWAVPVQLAVGAAVGLAVGFAGRWVLRRVDLAAGGLYAGLALSLALLSFAAATLLFGSGLLAAYVTGIVLGAGPLPYRAGLLRFHDALAWLSQVGMFLVLGLLVVPSRLVDDLWRGLALGLFLSLVARPVATALCLAPFRFPRREVALLGWVGLRGAVPIILATFPVMAGLGAAEPFFHLVFFIVVLNSLVPGSTVPRVVRWLGLGSRQPEPPHAVLEMVSHRVLDGDVDSFTISRALPVCGVPVAEIPFPEGSTLMLVVRDRQLIAPRGDTELLEGDHVYVFSRTRDRHLLRLLFGQSEEP